MKPHRQPHFIRAHIESDGRTDRQGDRQIGRACAGAGGTADRQMEFWARR